MFRSYSYQFYEMAHAALRAGPGGVGRRPLRLPQSLEPAVEHAFRPEPLGGGRALRARDAPLREADVRAGRDRGRRRRLSGPRGRRLEQAVLQSPALRPAGLSRGSRTAQDADRRADVRPLRDSVARHGRGFPAPFDVYITDWADARMAPLAVGTFDLDDYIDYLRAILEHLGPGVHTLGVCQPSVPLLAAVALMEANGDPNAPASMTLMGGPIDTRRSPTEVNKLAERRGVEWFRAQLPAYGAVSLSGLRPRRLSRTSFSCPASWR